jgi:alkylation response protein AidB-like acyl-CoA dehydrogenase
MNLDFTDEQSLLRDSVERFVRSHYSLEQRRTLAESPRGHSVDHWRSMADLGWLALPFSVDDGGLGGTAVDTMIVMEQFGRGLVLEPYFASIVAGGAALRRGASAAVREEILPGVMDGSSQLAFAHSEPTARFDIEYVAASARADGDAFVLNGTKAFVLNAATATHLVVSARTSREAADPKGISVFLVDAKTPGVELQSYPTVDGLRASEVTLRDVRVPARRLLGKRDDGYDIVNDVANESILALGAEALGAMEVLYKDTVEYTQQRVQFDHPLADFQVLQHRMVDMFVEFELAKSMVYRATLQATRAGEGSESAELQRSVHALKYMIAKSGTFIAENAVQLHGGMGMTEELRVGHYFKRLTVIDLLFGNGDYHLRRFAA